MKVSRELISAYDSKIQIADTRDGGNASWGEKEGYEDTSVRLAWYKPSGGFDPISSAELPIWGLAKLVETAADYNLLETTQCAEIIGKLADSIVRNTAERSIHINCGIRVHSEHEFLDYWAQRYSYKFEDKYIKNIGKPLTQESLLELFTWKNGTPLSDGKLQSILDNYPLPATKKLEERYLDDSQPGGPIWNIFFLHCLEPNKYPIFDQHTFRAMHYLQKGEFVEISTEPSEVYRTYKERYIPFVRDFGGADTRQADKALFTFGRYVKAVKKFL